MSNFDLANLLALPIAVVGVLLAYYGWRKSSKSFDQELMAEAGSIRDRLSVGADSETKPPVNRELGDKWNLERLQVGKTSDADQRFMQVIWDQADELQTLRRQLDQDERRYRLLREYASQGLAQSKLSFRLSIGAASLGFVVIIIGVVLAIIGYKPAVAAIPLYAGAVVEASAGLFFVQDRKTQEKMIEFFDKLRDDRKLDESLALMREVERTELKDRLRILLSIHFSGLTGQGDVFRQTVGERTSEEADPTHDGHVSTTLDDWVPDADREDGSKPSR